MHVSVLIFVVIIILLLVLLFLGTDPVKVGTAALLLIAVEMMMGVELLQIGIGMLVLIFLALLLMVVFFSVSLLLFLIFRPGQAAFEEIVPLKEAKAGFASYSINGEVFYCIYPIEFLITKYFYKESRTVSVRYHRFKRRNLLFDAYSRVVLLIGLSFSLFFFVIITSVLQTFLAL